MYISRVKNFLEYLKLFSANLDRIRFLGCHTNNIWKAHERSLGHFINKLLFVASSCLAQKILFFIPWMGSNFNYKKDQGHKMAWTNLKLSDIGPKAGWAIVHFTHVLRPC